MQTILNYKIFAIKMSLGTYKICIIPNHTKIDKSQHCALDASNPAGVVGTISVREAAYSIENVELQSLNFITQESGIIYISMQAPKMMSPVRVIKPKAMENNKGREWGHKIGKMGRRRIFYKRRSNPTNPLNTNTQARTSQPASQPAT